MAYLAEIIAGDSLEGLRGLADASVSLVLTSPPYGTRRNYKRVDPAVYPEWFEPWAAEIRRVLAPDGSFILNINDHVVGGAHGAQSHYVFKLVVKLVEELGYILVRDYIWYNPATPPNIFSSGRYGRTKKSHEYVFWFAKAPGWKFRMESILKPYSKSTRELMKRNEERTVTRVSGHSFRLNRFRDRGGADPGSVITIPSPTGPRVCAIRRNRDPGSVLAVSNTVSNTRFRDLCRQLNTRLEMAVMPEEVAEFFVKAATDEGDLVVDPFAGTGTTLAVAQRLGRRAIGWELHDEFVGLAKRRLDSLVATK